MFMHQFSLWALFLYVAPTFASFSYEPRRVLPFLTSDKPIMLAQFCKQGSNQFAAIAHDLDKQQWRICYGAASSIESHKELSTINLPHQEIDTVESMTFIESSLLVISAQKSGLPKLLVCDLIRSACAVHHEVKLEDVFCELGSVTAVVRLYNPDGSIKYRSALAHLRREAIDDLALTTEVKVSEKAIPLSRCANSAAIIQESKDTYEALIAAPQLERRGLYELCYESGCKLRVPAQESPESYSTKLLAQIGAALAAHEALHADTSLLLQQLHVFNQAVERYRQAYPNKLLGAAVLYGKRCAQLD